MWHFSFWSRPKMKKSLRDNLWLPLKLNFLPSKITKIMVPFFNYKKSMSSERITWRYVTKSHVEIGLSNFCHITFLREWSFCNTWTKVIILFCVYSTCDWCDVFVTVVTGLDKIIDFSVTWWWKYETWKLIRLLNMHCRIFYHMLSQHLFHKTVP